MDASKNPEMAKNRILIAGDNVFEAELLSDFLTEQGYEVQVVDCERVLAEAADFRPKLILLDLITPAVHGFELCKLLKRDPATRGTWVLMVGGLNELGDIERAVQSGTDDFLSTPVNKIELLKRVKNLMRL
jgi:PleD family two-component response regulator